MFGMGIWELLVILAIVVVVFGAGKLPQLGEGLGKGIKNFKEATKADEPEKIDESAPNSENKA